MAIEIYDSAKVIKKDDKYYYLIKCGSKNCYTCPNQRRLDNNFRWEYLRRQSRDSDWNVIAIGSENDHREARIALTSWNCPTSWVYGLIRFGNKKNIALALVKSRVIDFYSLEEDQQTNLNQVLRYGELSEYTIHLDNIPENKKFKAVHEYCDDKDIILDMGSISYGGKIYWNLNNL